MQFMERYLEDTLDLGTDRMILAPGWGSRIFQGSRCGVAPERAVGVVFGVVHMQNAHLKI